MKEYNFTNAVVRIHEGKRTAEERRKVLEESAMRLALAVEKYREMKEK